MAVVHCNMCNEHVFITLIYSPTIENQFSAGENCLKFNASFYQFQLAGNTFMILKHLSTIICKNTKPHIPRTNDPLVICKRPALAPAPGAGPESVELGEVRI